ncbi:MAG: hypothetical protein RLZZ299_806 [Pseudomonadota bacterium]
MNVGLLAPAALAGAVLLAVTVAAHLQRRPPRDTRPFGAMLLLARMTQRTQRRTQVHDRLLMALRLLALALLVLAAARPELRRREAPATVGGTGRVIVVLDTSLSMDAREGGDPVFARARTQAAAELRALPATVQVAVVTAGSPAATVVGWTADAHLAASHVESLERGDVATDLRGALVAARTLLEGRPGEILLYTDEAGPGLVEACAADLARLLELGSAVLPRRVRPAAVRNVAPVAAEYGDGLEGGTVRVTLANWGDTAREVTTTVRLPDGAHMTAFVEVPGADASGPGTAEEAFTVPRQATGGVARVEVDDPDLPADNARAFHLPQVGASRVLVVDGDPGSSPTRSEVYFLERALAPAGGAGPAVDVVPASGLGRLDPARHRVVFAANVADPGPYAPSLLDFVRRGGGLVLAMGDNVTAARWNAALSALLPAPLRTPRDLFDAARAEDPGVPLLDPDASASELLRPFARGGTFGRVHARRVMTLEPFATEGPDAPEVPLRWEGGLPALVARQVGTGRVLLWTSTLDLGWTNLPVQSVYMPLVQRLTAVLGGQASGVRARADGIVGESVTVELPGEVADVEVASPAGALVPSERDARRVRFVPSAPGAWSVRDSDGEVFAWVAVNTPPPESDVRAGAGWVEAQARIAPERMVRRWPLAPWAWVAGAGVLLMAAWVGRGRQEDV